MDFKNFTAGKDDAERRLDKILRRFLNDESLSSIYKSLRKGLVKVNGKRCDGNYRVCEGDVISIADFLLNKNDEAKPENLGESEIYSGGSDEKHNLDKKTLQNLIVFKNESILILNKPYDIPSQPSSSTNGKSLAELVQKEYEKNHENASLSFKTGPLHRLDRKTTGLLAFSQNLKGAKWFSQAIKTHEIQKIYLAILEGNLLEKQVWEDFIEKLDTRNQDAEIKNQKSEKFHTVTANSESGKLAHTEVFPIEHGIFHGKKITLARILIESGRTHQIRSQSAYHGFPLLGDVAYGGSKIEAKRFGQDFFLHAEELHFPGENPLNLPETLTAKRPESFEKMLATCNLQ